MKNLYGSQFNLLNKLHRTLYFICGPTAVGKSSLALRLAKKIEGMIINADSMQVYSNLEILTARPSIKDHQMIQHKLYGYIDGSVRYNVARWCEDTLNIINENIKKKIPSIIVGGTGMYINSLINGIIDLPSIPENYKKESENLFNELGLENFVKLINTFDPSSLKNISISDSSRLKRIWEIYKSTEIPYSEWVKKKNKIFLKNFSFKIFLFLPDREKIYLSVNDRFNLMLNGGGIDEVKNLLDLKLKKTLPIMKAHGVPEISNFLTKKYTFEECAQRGQQVTRNYVKRQLTWWRSSKLPIHQAFNQFPNEIDENLIKI